MKRQWTGMCAAAALVVLAACGGGDDEADVPDDTPAEQPAPTPPTPATNLQLPEGVTAEMVTAGQQVFNSTTCFTCHGQNGVGGTPLAPPLNDQTWINIDGEYTSIQEVVRTGVAQPKEHPGPMPAMGGASLTDEQVREVSAYVYSISRGG